MFDLMEKMFNFLFPLKCLYFPTLFLTRMKKLVEACLISKNILWKPLLFTDLMESWTVCVCDNFIGDKTYLIHLHKKWKIETLVLFVACFIYECLSTSNTHTDTQRTTGWWGLLKTKISEGRYLARHRYLQGDRMSSFAKGFHSMSRGYSQHVHFVGMDGWKPKSTTKMWLDLSSGHDGSWVYLAIHLTRKVC